MNITLSIDDKVVDEARKVAAAMGKSLNEIIREDLERLTTKSQRDQNLQELINLSGQGSSENWRFDRDELHERT
jgi:antitoxin component of RelBE/YafQ-DinJ toxin-antitoxin module